MAVFVSRNESSDRLLEWNIKITTQAEAETGSTVAAGTQVMVGAHAMMVMERTA